MTIPALLLLVLLMALQQTLASDKDTTDTEWGQATLPTQSSRIREDDTCENDANEEDAVEVAIVGGGLAGLAMAIGLSRTNIP